MTPGRCSRIVGLSLLVAASGIGMQAVTARAQDASAAAAAPAAQKIVKSITIRFQGARTMDDGRVRSQMSLREGEAYADERVEQDIRTLYGTGAIDDVAITSADVPGGVAVTVTLTGRGAIGDISFAGNTVFNDDRLRREIDVKSGNAVDELSLTASQGEIRELYEKAGYGDVSVTYQTQPGAQEGFTSVIFNIDEGARGLIGDIRFEGNQSIKSSRLRKVLKSKKKTFWRFWGKAGKLSNEAIQEDINAIESLYQDSGYVYADVVEVRREPIDAKRVGLVYVISEGDSYDIAEVALEGVTVFTQEELAPGIITEAGFPYSRADIRSDEQMIKDYYGSRGYADARVETSILSAGPREVRIVYRVTEGEKSYIRKVNIAGNDVTQDRVIRRELPFSPGEETDTVKMRTGESRLKNLNYFSNIDMRAVDTGAPGFKDIDVDVVEQSTGTINFGAGFSSIDSLVGFLDLTQTNFDITDWPSFRGAGQRFNMSARVGLKRRDFQLSLTEPWFMGQKLSFTTQLYYRNLFFLSDKYDETDAGGSLGLRKPMGEHTYFDITYTLQNVTIDGISDDASDIIRSEEGDYLQSKLNLSLVHDTRDNVFITRKGHKVELGAMTSGQFLGGDVDVYGMSVQGAQYFNLPGDTILSFEGAFRSVDSYGDNVPIFERLFLGGANNLRGFNYRDVGPKDDSGEPIGGRTSAYLTTELTFPIMEKVRGAVFYDVGFVNGSAFDISTSNVNSNVGLGLRLYLPVGPIRVDFGIPVQSDPYNDSGGKFQFNVGYKF